MNFKDEENRAPVAAEKSHGSRQKAEDTHSHRQNAEASHGQRKSLGTDLESQPTNTHPFDCK